MAISSTYTGNGSAGPFTIGFAYLNATDVKVEVDSVLQTQGTNFTVAGSALTFTSGSEPANGAVIYIYRDTASASPVALFSAGAPIKAADLNNNYTQNRYVAEEADSKSDDAVSTSNTAKTTADSAVTTANSAVTTANTAASDASSAVTTANTAASDAASAVTTANSATTTANNAVTTANSAVTTANTAASDAASAVTTANTAATDAASAVTTANTASTNASNAVTTANTAASDASTALSTANTAASDASTALSTANTAATNASTAITTANTAATDAASAVTTANTAASDAASAVTTANTAASDASSAVTTANTAATDASNAVSTANAASAAVSGKLDKSGGTMTGAIDMGSNLINAVTDPVSAQDAATKNYVDTEISGLVDSAPGTLDTLNELAAALGDDANFSTTVTNSIATKLPLAGGTMSGAINMGSNLINAVTDPVSAQDAATKNYVDTQNSTQDTTIATKLPLAGGTMSGAIDMGSNLINNVTDPASAQDAATKNYVDTANSTQDTAIAAKLPLSGGTMTGDITFNSGQTIDGYIVETSATGSAEIPAGTDAQRDASPSAGYMRFNTTSSTFEGYDGTSWTSIGAGSSGPVDADTLDTLDSTSFLRSDADDTATGRIEIERGYTSDTDYHLYINQTTNTEGATIKFTDNDAESQYGLFTYKHADSASNGAGNSFHFNSSESETAVIIDQTAGNSGFYVGTNEVLHTGNSTSGDNYITFGPNSTWSSYLRVGGNGYTATGTEMASMVTTDGNLHLDAANSNNAIYMNWYGGTSGTKFGNGSQGQVAIIDSSGNITGNGNGYFARVILNTNLIGWAGSGNHSDGYPYARFTEGWGTVFSSPDTRWTLSTTGSFLCGFQSGGTNHGSGNILATGNITAYYSDERLKTKLGPIENALEKLSSLEGFRYVDNDLAKSFGYNKSEPQLGVSAQAVQKIAPEVVSLAPFDMTGDNDPNGDGKVYSKSGEHYLTVQYDRLVPLLIEAIKEQQSQIEELKKGLSDLMGANKK